MSDLRGAFTPASAIALQALNTIALSLAGAPSPSLTASTFPHTPSNFHAHARTPYRYPHGWIDSYHDGASRLFDAFSPRTLPPNACVLWRTSNVGPRIGDVPGQRSPASRRQHPSARNGMHEWLNRWSSALARKAEIGVLDLSDLTADLALSGSQLEAFDYYHGFNSSILLRPFVERACRACGWQYGSQ